MNRRPPMALGTLTISRADQSTGRQQPARKRLAAQFATSGLQWGGSDLSSDTPSQTNRRRRVAGAYVTLYMEELSGLHREEEFTLLKWYTSALKFQLLTGYRSAARLMWSSIG